MGAVRDLVEELRRRGVTVHEWPGWDGRGNADGGVGPRVTQINPAGAVIHHTGSNYGPAYAGLVSSTRPDLLGGCLCNFAGNEDGSLTVIASGLAWHAGPGVGPSLGPVLSRVPNIRTRMNLVTVGLEIVYPGSSPMRPEQYRTACVFGAAVADLFAGGDPECVRAHAETNGNVPGGSGKWDPGCAPGRTIDMAAFRRDAALAASAPAPAPSEEDDMARLITTDRDDRVLYVDHDSHSYYHVKSPDVVKWLKNQGVQELPGKQPFNMLADYVNRDAVAAAGSVPVAAGSTGSLSDADLDRIAKAVADEQFRRQAA